MRYRYLACLLCITSVNLPLLAEVPPVGADPWNFTFTPYLWFAEIDGDITLRGRTGDADVSFSDIWDNLNIGFMGRLEGWDSPWGFFLDGVYMNLETDYSTPEGLVSADLDLDMTILEFGLGYRLWETDVGQNGSMFFDVFGGGRYFKIKSDLDIIPGGPLADLICGSSFSRREEWVDPLVGGRLTWNLNEVWSLAVRGDVGGFGIGEASDLTWNIVAGVACRLSERVDLRAGYRILDIDYDSGSGTDEFGLDTQFRGPIIGMGILF